MNKKYITQALSLIIVLTMFTGCVQVDESTEIDSNYNPEERFVSNEFEAEVLNVFSALLNLGNMSNRVVGNIGSLGGSEYGYNKSQHINYLRSSTIGMDKPIKIWANSGIGKGSRFAWHYVDKNNIGNVPDLVITMRKVMIDKKGHAITHGRGNIMNNIPQIVESNVIASGDVLFVFPERDEEYHLELIKSLFKTKTARFLMSITQKDLYVRGFENIPDYTLFLESLNGNLFSDSWFYKEFQFSNVLIDHIENFVSEKVEV